MATTAFPLDAVGPVRTLEPHPICARSARACAGVVAGLSLWGCQPSYERPLTVNDAEAIAGDVQPRLEPGMDIDVHEPREHARSHVLLGIDFSKPLKLPECAKYYDRFDRPESTCVYLGDVDHKPFKIEFEDGAVPDFMKWNNATVSTDARGHPQMMRFDIGSDPALQGKAVDAMLEKFGPPTTVENAGGRSKVGTWQHQDYVIQYFFDPNGAAVQMETKKFHDEPTVSVASDEANRAKL